MLIRKILLVEDNETHAHVICRHLTKGQTSPNQVQQVGTLGGALELMASESFDAILLDLSLPDSSIPETLTKLVDSFPAAAVVVLTSLDDLDFAATTVQQGAQDYLVKTDLNADSLERAIRYAIERKRAQKQLKQYAEKLEQSNKHLESFARTLAHEVRSPLTIVSGCLQIIQATEPNLLEPDTRQLVADSLTAVNGMTQLIEGLLEFSQAESTARSFQWVNLEEVFYYVYAVLRPTLKSEGAELTHDALPTVIGDEVQLRQLLQNLIVNAIKYRSPRDLKIHVGADDDELKDAWVIRVADNGRGIAVEDQGKIFAAFARLENTRHISGVGIGLAFCQRIIDHHAGKLWVESEPDVGSTFLFALPKSNPVADSGVSDSGVSDSGDSETDGQPT